MIHYKQGIFDYFYFPIAFVLFFLYCKIKLSPERLISTSPDICFQDTLENVSLCTGAFARMCECVWKDKYFFLEQGHTKDSHFDTSLLFIYLAFIKKIAVWLDIVRPTTFVCHFPCAREWNRYWKAGWKKTKRKCENKNVKKKKDRSCKK